MNMCINKESNKIILDRYQKNAMKAMKQGNMSETNGACWEVQGGALVRVIRKDLPDEVMCDLSPERRAGAGPMNIQRSIEQGIQDIAES